MQEIRIRMANTILAKETIDENKTNVRQCVWQDAGLAERYESETGWIERPVWAMQDSLDGEASAGYTGCTERCDCHEQNSVLSGLTFQEGPKGNHYVLIYFTYFKSIFYCIIFLSLL